MKKLILSTLMVGLLAVPSFAILAKGMGASGVIINNTQGVAAQEFPNVIADGAGNIIVAWHDYKSGAAALYAQSFDSNGAARWSPAAGVPICTVTNFIGSMIAFDANSLLIHMVSDGAGGVIIAWNDYRSDGTTPHLYAQRINGSGVVQWSANGKLVCDAANGQGLNSMVSDGAGGALLAWTDQRNFVNGSDIYAQRIDSGGASLWALNGVKIFDNVTTVAGGNHPLIVSDGSGGAIITWDDYRTGAPYYGIYAQRVNAAGAVQWAANGVAVSALGSSTSINPKIVSDNLGGAIIAYWDERQNPGAFQYGVYAQRIDGSGSVQWLTNGITLCAQSVQSDNNIEMDIVTDGGNGAIVSWQDLRNVMGGVRIYAQKVTTNGTPEWTADGVPVNTIANNSSYSLPRMVADGSGGFYLTTANLEGVGMTQDIRVHRLNSSGGVVVGWTDGKPVGANTTHDQFSPRLAYDSISGQVVVVWKEPKNDTRGDIWGQALASGGMYGWGTTTGKELIASTGAATQRYPAVASDGAGGGVVVWEDVRSVDFYQIYSQRFNSSGSVLWAPDGVAIATLPLDNLRPSICRTSDGYYIMAWTIGSNIYVQKVNSGGAAQWEAGGVIVASSFGYGFYYPVVASDGAGGAVVAYSVGPGGAVTKTGSRPSAKLWASAYLSDLSDEDLPDLNGLLLAKNGGGPGGPGTFRIYYKRIASDGSIVTPYGGAVQNSGTLGVLATTYHDAVNGEIQLWPSIAKVDAENVAITWDDKRTIILTNYWGIYAQKVRINDGTRLWTDDAQVVTIPGGTTVTYYPWIGSGGTDGTAVVAWMQSATSGMGHNYDIKANKLTSDGTLSWSSGINVANDGSLDEIRPKVAVDSSGTSFFVWQEGTWSGDAVYATTLHPSATMSNGAIYSQLVDSSGSLSGSKFQVSSSAANLNYEAPDIATSSTAGTDIVVYDTDIFAQSVSGLAVAPGAPTNFAGAAASSSSINWTWTDNANDETGDKVLNTQNNSIIVTIPTANTNSYTESNLSPNTAYTRSVLAYNNSGNSSASNTATVYTLASAPSALAATTAQTSLSLSWTGDGSKYKVERGTSANGPWTTLSETLTGKTYEDGGLTAGTTYWYKISAANGDNVWSAGDAGSFTTGATATKLSPQIGGAKHRTNLAAANNDYMSSKGGLKLNIQDTNTDGRINYVKVEFLNSVGTLVKMVEYNEAPASVDLAEPLPAGTYNVRITANSIYGTTAVRELTLKVSDKLEMTKAPVVYPMLLLRNTIKAQGVAATQLAYQLSKDGNMSMVIYSVDGQIVYRGDYVAGTNGGSAGPNAVSWDGYTTRGVPVGRGLLLVQFFDRDSKQNLGKAVIHVQ